MPSITINNTVLNFTNIYYVDASEGLDSAAGTLEAPFKTVARAVQACAASGDAVYAFGGVHDVTHVSGSNGTGGLFDDGKSISFVGEPNKTIFLCDGTKNPNRDHHAVSTYGAGTKIYNIIFDHQQGNRTDTYATSLFGRDANTVNVEIYNCVLKTSAVNPSLMYGSVASAIRLYNCVIIANVDLSTSYSGGSAVYLTNCVSNKAIPDGNKTTCLVSSLDNLFNILVGQWKNAGTGTDYDGSVADIGVYGGAFGWYVDRYLIQDGTSIKTIIDKELKIVGDTISENLFVQYGFTDISDLSEMINVAYVPFTDAGYVGSGKLFKASINRDDVSRIGVK